MMSPPDVTEPPFAERKPPLVPYKVHGAVLIVLIAVGIWIAIDDANQTSHNGLIPLDGVATFLYALLAGIYAVVTSIAFYWTRRSWLLAVTSYVLAIPVSALALYLYGNYR